MTFLKSAGPSSRPTQEMEYCPGEAGSRVGVISGAFGNILLHIFCESSAEPVLIKVMGLYSGSALNRDGPLNYKEKKATSMSSGSCSLGTCVFTRRPTGRKALRLRSLPLEVPSRLHASRLPEDPHPREAFLL